MFTRKILTAGLIAGVLLLSSAMAAEQSKTYPSTSPSTTTPTTKQSMPSDATLAGKVKTALIENDTTKAHEINVEVYKGQVQLNGFVDTAEQRTTAAQVAGKVAGVTSVKNNLAVKSHERSAGESLDDGVITTKVKAALIGDSRTKAHQIDVTTRSGIVQLGGFVDSATAKSAAAEVAESVEGVKSVQNGLNVRN